MNFILYFLNLLAQIHNQTRSFTSKSMLIICIQGNVVCHSISFLLYLFNTHEEILVKIQCTILAGFEDVLFPFLAWLFLLACFGIHEAIQI